MKIAFVAPSMFPCLASDYSSGVIGGAERQQAFLANVLAELGQQVAVIVEKPNTGFVQLSKTKIETVMAYRAGSGLPFFRFIHPKLTGLWQALSTADADIYFVRAASFLTALVAFWCNIHNKPWIFSGAHDTDFIPGSELVPNFRDRCLYRWGLRRADLIFGQNQSQKELCKINFGLDLTVLNNYSPDPIVTSTPKKDGSIVWVSTIRRWKQPERLFQLANILRHYKFIMIGGSDREDLSYFDSIKKTSKDHPNIQFMGFLPPSEVEKFLDSALAILNTSDIEGFPNTFLQAWRRGLPVISFFDPGGVVASKKLGYIIDSVHKASLIIPRLIETWTLYNVRHVQEYYINNHQGGVIKQLLTHMGRLEGLTKKPKWKK